MTTTRPPTPDILGNIMDGVPVATGTPAATLLALSAITNDGGTQMRAGMNADTVKEYEGALTDAEAWPFPPVIVYHDGAKYWLADGFHRLNAAHRSGKFSEIPADIKAGTQRDAVLYAAGANASHGLRRTNDDKKRAVKALLEDQEWSKWSDREIARRCAVSAMFVGNLRKELSVNGLQMPTERTVERSGQTYQQNTANIGANRSQPPAMLAVWELQATVREVYAQVYGGNPEPYATRDMRTGAQMRAGRFWLLCTQSLPANQFRLSDLAQAINNVAAQVEAQAPVVTTTIAPTVAYVVAADDPAEPERSTAPTAHQSEPIQYAEIWKLQSIVRGLSMSPTRGFGAFDAKTMAELLRRAAANRSADDFWNACIGSIQKQRLAHRTNDLVQAINNYASKIETKYDVRSDDRPLPAWAADATSDEETQEPEDRQQQLVELLIDATRDEYAEWILAAAEGKHPRIFIMCENLASQEQYFGFDLKAALRQVSKWRYDTNQIAPANPRPVPLMSQRAATPEPVMATVAQTVADVVEVHGEPAPVAVETVEVTTPVSQRADYESDEWYTPQEYIDAAKAVMGAIDLDPASSEMAQTVVRAGVYLTRFDDGLAQTRWIHQRVWLNPPYSNPAPWIEKLVREHQAGPFCTEAIVLVNNATETSWFQLLLERFPVCLPARRLAFWRHDHANAGARQGQAFFYVGPNVAKFQEVFSQFGPILREAIVTTTYQFAAQLQQGESYEEKIDAFFRSKFAVQISAVSRASQRNGIDRVWYDVADDRTWTVEYKADSLAGKTGNAFIETISVDTEQRPGWAYSSQASLLVYLVTDPQTIYVISMARLRRNLARWAAVYPTRQAANDGYNTHGLLVPLHELERIAAAVY